MAVVALLLIARRIRSAKEDDRSNVDKLYVALAVVEVQVNLRSSKLQSLQQGRGVAVLLTRVWVFKWPHSDSIVHCAQRRFQRLLRCAADAGARHHHGGAALMTIDRRRAGSTMEKQRVTGFK